MPTPQNPRHFLSLNDLSPDEIRGVIQRAIALKKDHLAGAIHEPLKNRVLGMIFENASTRTRVSAEVAMTHLGGSSVFLSPNDSQLGRGEPVADTAKVLSQMVDAVFIRTNSHEKLTQFAAHSHVPVINALTDLCHPCQLLADIQTYEELRGDIRHAVVTWVGDGNNMCHSYINASRLLGFELHLACPDNYQPDPEVLNKAPQVTSFHSANDAVTDADLIVTDVWASMGYEEEQKKREKAFANYQVNETMMSFAKKEALFMHCLPAHRGEEVSAGVIDGEQSVVWDEAGNRLHSLKALLELLLCH